MIWSYFADDSEMLETAKHNAFNMAASLYGQLRWRFQYFKEWPYFLTQGVKMTTDQRVGLCETFFQAAECYLEPGMALKIRKLFPTDGAMSQDVDFWHFLALYVKDVRVCNMQIERLLATFKRAVANDRKPLMERVFSHSLLTQFIGEHIRNGGPTHA